MTLSTALVKAKEQEIDKKQAEVEKATKVSVMKKKKAELAILRKDLAKLKKEEEEAKIPVARLHDLLNTQLDKEVSNDDRGNMSGARKLLLSVPGVAACHGDNVEEDLETVDSGIYAKKQDEKDSSEARTSRFEHILDVICG